MRGITQVLKEHTPNRSLYSAVLNFSAHRRTNPSKTLRSAALSKHRAVRFGGRLFARSEHINFQDRN